MPGDRPEHFVGHVRTSLLSTVDVVRKCRCSNMTVIIDFTRTRAETQRRSDSEILIAIEIVSHDTK